MANIAISELDTYADTLENEDLILVSKNNGSSFTSAKMKGSVLKGSSGSCSFSSDAVKTACQQAIDSKSLSTLTAAQVKTQVESALTSKNISTVTTSDIKSQCSSAISETTVSVSGLFIDINKFADGRQDGSARASWDYTSDALKYDSEVFLTFYPYKEVGGGNDWLGYSSTITVNDLPIMKISNKEGGSAYQGNVQNISFKLRKGSILKVTTPGSHGGGVEAVVEIVILPLS